MSEQILGLRLFKEVDSCMTLVGDISNYQEVNHVTRSWIADSVLVGFFTMTCSGQSLQHFGLTTYCQQQNMEHGTPKDAYLNIYAILSKKRTTVGACRDMSGLLSRFTSPLQTFLRPQKTPKKPIKIGALGRRKKTGRPCICRRICYNQMRLGHFFFFF